MLARIYSPAKNAMQSGKHRKQAWVLEYVPSVPKVIDPFMGYTSTTDMMRQIKVSFSSQADAEAYAKRENIAYQVEVRRTANIRKHSYAANFDVNRVYPWTH